MTRTRRQKGRSTRLEGSNTGKKGPVVGGHDVPPSQGGTLTCIAFSTVQVNCHQYHNDEYTLHQSPGASARS